MFGVPKWVLYALGGLVVFYLWLTQTATGRLYYGQWVGQQATTNTTPQSGVSF